MARIVTWLRRGLYVAWLAAIGGVIALAAATHLASTVVIKGGSMAPRLPTGSLAVLEPYDADRLHPGDVVTARADNAVLVTHRVTRVVELDGGTYVELKGDANASPDPVLVAARSIVGRVTFSLPVAGYLAAMLSTALGLISVVAMLAALLAVVTWLEQLEGELAPRPAKPAATRARKPRRAVVA